MKIAFETIAWGLTIEDMESVLDTIASAGFQGVEIAQRFDALNVLDVESLCQQLAQRHLTFVGLVGGTLTERMRFCGTPCVEYLYVEPWELDRIPEVLRRGFTPALHPRVFTAIRGLDETVQVLAQQRDLRLILDTAHSWLAGDDPVEAIRRTQDRLVAVHLKDWTPEFGRSNYRYGRGFIEPERGVVPVKKVIEELRRQNFQGWLVLEVDKPTKSPEDTIHYCAEWLYHQGLLSSPPLRRPCKKVCPNPPMSSDVFTSYTAHEAVFREALMHAATLAPREFYLALAVAIKEFIPARLVQLWVSSPTQEQLALVASLPLDTLEPTVSAPFRPDDLLSGIAMYRRAARTPFDLRSDAPGEPYGYPERQYHHPDLRHRLQLTTLSSLPIYNSGNHNYVRMLIDIYPQDERCMPSDATLGRLSRALTLTADLMLDSRCAQAAARVPKIVAHSQTPRDLTHQLCVLLQDFLDCEGVTLFLVDEAQEKLGMHATTGLIWAEGVEHYYHRGEGLAGKVWRRGEPLLTMDVLREPDRARKSEEDVATPDRTACLIVPLINIHGVVIGVVRCRNKRLSPDALPLTMFLEEDAAIVDAICASALPHLTNLLNEEVRWRTLATAAHELRAPVVAIRAIIDAIQHDATVLPLLPDDSMDEMWLWTENLRRILGNIEVWSSKHSLRLQIPAPLDLLQEVILPAAEQVEMLRREKEFALTSQSYDGFRQLPKLWIDREYFQQVVFNLLSNALKYAGPEPEDFKMAVVVERTPEAFEIRFRDWGIGIDSRYQHLVFEAGFRAPEAMLDVVNGNGLGLWIVRRLVEAHGGTVDLTRFQGPTEITVRLPVFLERHGPRPSTEPLAVGEPRIIPDAAAGCQ